MTDFFAPSLLLLTPHTDLNKIALVLLALLVAMVFALLLTPLAIKLAIKFGVVDRPHARRVHTHTTPRWGGLAMFGAFIITTLALAPVRYYLLHENMLNERVIGILVGGTLMTAVGALDDKYNVPAKLKLLGQIVAATVAVLPFHLRLMVAFNVDIPIWPAVVLTVIWIVAITNTVNLIDGLDGLAAGICAIAAATFVIIGVFMKGTTGEAMLAAMVVGVCLGFLHYNFHPAKVFMGDAGSHFLGFTIAVLSVLQNWKVATGVAFAVPILILAVPIFDTAFAVLRRLHRGQPIFSPDKGHIHHRLLSLGLNQRSVVLVIYLLTAFGCMLALLLTRTRLWNN